MQPGATGRNENGDECDGPLDARQLRAVELYLAGRTVSEVAAELGVNRSTSWRWAALPEVRREIARRRDARRCAVSEGLQSAALEAVSLLTALTVDPTARPGDRIRAACAVLDRAGWASSSTPAAAEGIEGWADREAERAYDAEHPGILDELAELGAPGKRADCLALVERAVRGA